MRGSAGIDPSCVIAEKQLYASHYFRTALDPADLPGYMDEFVGASFVPHTTPDLLCMGTAPPIGS